MGRIILLFLLAFLSFHVESFAQKGTYALDPVTKQVFDFNPKYTFAHYYTKDLRDKESLRTYKAACHILITISGEGTGKMINIYHEKIHTYSIVSCYKHEGYYLFELIDSNNNPLNARLHLKEDAAIDKLSLEGNPTTTVFF